MTMSQYWREIKQGVRALKGDGCTGAPDLEYRRCCDEHDFHARTGVTIDGHPITEAEAALRLFRCMRAKRTHWLKRLVVPAVYWTGVRLFGWWAWKGA